MPPTKSISIPNSDFEFICFYLLIGASSSLATASSEHENLHSAYQDLETKLAEAETKRERAEKQFVEKKSKLLQKEADFVMKRKVDSDTLQELQKEIQGLRNYMTTAEQCWDLLNADVMGKNLDLKNQINPLDSN
jgi:predicted  nucleic acid-binding Zn-ribbon protein